MLHGCHVRKDKYIYMYTTIYMYLDLYVQL